MVTEYLSWTLWFRMGSAPSSGKWVPVIMQIHVSYGFGRIIIDRKDLTCEFILNRERSLRRTRWSISLSECWQFLVRVGDELKPGCGGGWWRTNLFLVISTWFARAVCNHCDPIFAGEARRIVTHYSTFLPTGVNAFFFPHHLASNYFLPSSR